MARTLRRSRNLAVTIAILNQPKVDARLLMLLWHMADRWGVLRGGEVLLPAQLPHAVLAELLTARRPTVTTALGLCSKPGASPHQLRRMLHRPPPGAFGARSPPDRPERTVTAAPCPHSSHGIHLGILAFEFESHSRPGCGRATGRRRAVGVARRTASARCERGRGSTRHGRDWRPRLQRAYEWRVRSGRRTGRSAPRTSQLLRRIPVTPPQRVTSACITSTDSAASMRSK